MIGVEKGTEAVIGIERTAGFGKEIMIEKEIGTVAGTMTGNRNVRGVETEDLIMIGVPGTLIGKAEGIMNGAAVMEVAVIEKVLIEPGAGVAAGAEAKACKLAHHHLISIQLLKGMGARIGHLHLAIWLSSKIFMVILVIRKGMLARKGFLGGTMMVKKFLDWVVLLGGRWFNEGVTVRCISKVFSHAKSLFESREWSTL